MGYPTNTGNGSAIWDSDMFLINSTSENKDGAWKFIKCFLMPQYYELQLETKLGMDCQTPSRIDMYDMFFEDWMTTVESGVGKNEYGGYGLMLQEPVTQEDKDCMTQLIENANLSQIWNIAIENIVSEEAAPYFLGQKSVEEVMEIIQSRVQLYVDENR